MQGHLRDIQKDIGPTETRDPAPSLLPSNPLTSTRAGAGDEEMGLRPGSEDQLIISASQAEDMANTYDNAREGELALDASDKDIEMGTFRPNLRVKNGLSSTTATATTSEERKKLDFDLKVSVLLITISMIPLIDALFLHGPPAKLDPTVKLSAFFAFTAFVSAVSLLFHTLKLMIRPSSARVISNSLLRVSKILFATAAASLFLTCILITYSLLPKAYYFLPLALLPSLLVAGFHLLYRVEINPARIKALKKELKRATQLTLSLVSVSFSGFIGVLLAIYHKAASLGAAYSYVKVSVYLLLGGGIAGILALLLCRLLLSNNGEERRSGAWQRAILSAANAVLLTMLVSAVMIITETILHSLLVAAVFPVLAGASAWLVVEFFTETEDGNSGAHGTMYAIAVAVASVSFGAILTIFAGLLGGAVSREPLKTCTFLLASSFLASVSLGTVTSQTAQVEKTKASTEFAAIVLACCGLGTLVLAALAICYQVQV